MAYDRLQPIGPMRGDIQHAHLCSVLANVFRPTTAKAYSPADFLIHYGARYEGGGEDKIGRVIRQVAGVTAVAAPRGSVKVWGGAAPPIKRLGKRGKATSYRRKIQGILHGKPGVNAVPDRGRP